MVNRLALIIICLFFFSLQAECQKIDSLKSLLPGKTGAELADILFEIAYEYVDIDNEAATRYGLQGFTLASQLKDTFRIARTARILGAACIRRGAIDSAILFYSVVLPIARKRQMIDNLKKALNGLGNAYSFKANYDLALTFHFESLQLHEQALDSAAITTPLHNIGFVYYKLKNYDKALIFWHRCLDIKNRVHYNYDMDKLLISIGSAYAYKGDLTTAKKFVDSGIKSCGTNCSPEIVTMASFILGVIHFRAGEISKAERYALESYKVAVEEGDVRLQLDNIDNLCQIYIQQSKLDRALDYLHRAEDLINRGAPFNLELIKTYLQLSNIYRKNENYKKAAFFQEKYIHLKDSIYNEELTTNLMKLEGEYLEKENKAKISSQNQVLELKEEVIDRQKLVNIFIGALAITLMLLAVILVRLNRQKQIINRILDEKVSERTRQLEQSHDALMRLSTEQEILIQRTSQDINSSMATIKGLCNLGIRDVFDADGRQYISNMKLMLEQLEFAVKNLQSIE